MEAIPGRMGLLLTLLLCTINIFNSIESKYPKNATAIAQWILFCLLFIILAILEYAFLLGIKKYKKPGAVREASDLRYKDYRKNKKQSRMSVKSAVKATTKIEMLSENLDKWMLGTFPPAFISFAIIFWSMY